MFQLRFFEIFWDVFEYIFAIIGNYCFCSTLSVLRFLSLRLQLTGRRIPHYHLSARCQLLCLFYAFDFWGFTAQQLSLQWLPSARLLHLNIPDTSDWLQWAPWMTELQCASLHVWNVICKFHQSCEMYKTNNVTNTLDSEQTGFWAILFKALAKTSQTSD